MKQTEGNRDLPRPGARQFVHTTSRTKTKTRHFVQKPKPDISYKSET